MRLKKHYTMTGRRIMKCAFLIMLMMQSCFTGVESTPKIGKSDLRHNITVTTDEQKYLSDIEPAKFVQWHPGKDFLVVSPRISMIFTPGSIVPDINEGDILSFVEAREIISPVGKAVEIIFNKKGDGTPLVYRINSSMEELSARDEVDIPFTVDLEISELVRNRLAGKTYYITTPRWIDSNGGITTRVKFIPVNIIGVVPGNHDFPVRVIFSPQYKGFSPDVIYSLYLSVGTGPRATRNFDSQFSLKNPRDKHSAITDENWTAIIENRILPGMTREEARLSLGSPNDVERGHDYSSVYEKWTYDGGVYLIFRDGLLESFRK